MLNKTNKYQTLLAVCLLTLSACSTNETLTDSPIDQSKTPIELTVGIVGENTSTPRALTRTVITNDDLYGNAATAFENATSLYMVLKSEYSGTGAAQDPKYSRSIGTVPGSGGTNPLNVSFASGYQRYWEDSYSRDSKVSVYSACVPGNTNTTLNIASSTTYNQNDYTWSSTTITPTIDWPLTGVTGTLATQDAAFLTNQDLCFSNNVSGDNRIAFDTSTKKFLAKKMVFHHALTQVVFNIIKGEGFGSGENDFKFTTPGQNIVLTGFNTRGTLDISTGNFSDIDNTTPITSLASSTGTGFDYVLTCLMLPGSTLNGSDKDALDKIYFTIDENKYHITKSQLAGALASKTLTDNYTSALDEYKMRPGVKYIFTMTVSKKGIDKLSASVVPWEEVEAEQMTPSNARISVSVMTNGQKQTGTDASFDLYRSPYVNSVISDEVNNYNWGTGYTSNKAQLIESTTTAGEYTAYTNKTDLTTKWYWPDNKTFYHFRTVMPVNHTVNQDASNGDYLSLTGHIYNAAPENSYTDVCWGAPFNAIESGQKLTYSTTSGFDNTGLGDPATHQISKAIGPTTGTIVMKMIHMMSDVTITLTTPVSGDADYSARVNLENAKMELSNIYSGGKVLLGNGLVQTTESSATVSNQTDDTPTYCAPNWRYGFVPQSLEDVVLTITTADNNRYIVDMKDVKFTASSFNNNLIANPYTVEDGKCKINRWYPNFKYTYTFQLKKTGIETISATINDWVNISAETQTVQIK